MDPIVYTPSQPKQQPAPAPTYALVNDMTGKPPPKRGPQTLKAYARNEKEEIVPVEFKVPYPPKSNCKKCYGRGYVGINIKDNNRGILICKKCYPML